jgi:hypothetical protein
MSINGGYTPYLWSSWEDLVSKNLLHFRSLHFKVGKEKELSVWSLYSKGPKEFDIMH